MRKHSARLSLHVIDGLKRIRSLLARAVMFCLLRCLVRERLSWGSPRRSGLSLGKMVWILARALEVHS